MVIVVVVVVVIVVVVVLEELRRKWITLEALEDTRIHLDSFPIYRDPIESNNKFKFEVNIRCIQSMINACFCNMF